MKKLLIIHHNDSDGIMSAAIVKYWAEKNFKEKFIKYKELNYGYDEEELFKTYTDTAWDYVFVVDFSIDIPLMNLLRISTEHFIWIDHHKSAMERYSEYWTSIDIEGIRNLSDSAALLTWKYLFPVNKVPQAVEYINDYDLWKHELEDTKAFHEAFCLFCKIPDQVINSHVIQDDQDDVRRFINHGAILMQAKNERIKKAFSTGTDSIFEHHTAYIVNSQHDISDLGNYILANTFAEIAIIFYHDENKTRYSLRGRGSVDVAKLAEKFGGGGHKNAAGFSIYRI